MFAGGPPSMGLRRGKCAENVNKPGASEGRSDWIEGKRGESCSKNLSEYAITYWLFSKSMALLAKMGPGGPVSTLEGFEPTLEGFKRDIGVVAL
jgi:hypothetical protein